MRVTPPLHSDDTFLEVIGGGFHARMFLRVSDLNNTFLGQDRTYLLKAIIFPASSQGMSGVLRAIWSIGSRISITALQRIPMGTFALVSEEFLRPGTPYDQR